MNGDGWSVPRYSLRARARIDGANGRHGSRNLTFVVDVVLHRAVVGLARTLRAPRARGPTSMRPWNQPTILSCAKRLPRLRGDVVDVPVWRPSPGRAPRGSRRSSTRAPSTRGRTPCRPAPVRCTYAWTAAPSAVPESPAAGWTKRRSTCGARGACRSTSSSARCRPQGRSRSGRCARTYLGMRDITCSRCTAAGRRRARGTVDRVLVAPARPHSRTPRQVRLLQGKPSGRRGWTNGKISPVGPPDAARPMTLPSSGASGNRGLPCTLVEEPQLVSRSTHFKMSTPSRGRRRTARVLTAVPVEEITFACSNPDRYKAEAACARWWRTHITRDLSRPVRPSSRRPGRARSRSTRASGRCGAPSVTVARPGRRRSRPR